MAVAALLLATLPAHARTFALAQLSPAQLCTTAVDEIQQISTLPPHLLAAIARVESGRLDPRTRTWQPWPWTINVAGRGYFFASKAEAIAAVQALETSGVTSVDVGCMQINLQQHPHAFASLDMAFDPRMNARYASRFLGELFASTGSWTKAAEWYHSATPALGIPYGQKVMALLQRAIVLTPRARAERERELQRKELAVAWAATLDQTDDDGNALADGQ
jgi:Transglycosylase SLT domain